MKMRSSYLALESAALAALKAIEMKFCVTIR